MADNITLNSGSGGSVVRTDDDGTAHWQYVKLAYGADDTQTIVTSTATNPLPVALSDTDNTVLDNIQTAVELIDNAISGTEMQVDVVAALPTGSNTIGDVTVSGDALTALQLLDDAIFTDDTSTHSTGSTKGVGVMAAATPTDGSVAANDIGMLAMSTDRRLHTDAQIVGQDADITIADGGNSITVDGTVTANLSATDNAVLDNIQTAVELIDNAISGSEMQVDVVAALPTGSNTIGDVTISGSALTALQLIDDSVFADDAAFTLTSSKVTVAGAIRDDALSTLSAVEGDAVPLRVSSTGALHVTGGGGGTEYNEDDATPNPIVGTATLMERDDVLSAVTPAEADFIGLRGNARGALWVELDLTNDVTIADGGNSITVDNGGTFAVQVDAALPTGANTIGDVTVSAITPDVMLGTDFSNVLGTASLILATQADAVANTADGLQCTNFNMVFNGTTWDRVREGGTAGSILVDGSGVTQPISGTVTANLSATDNAVLDSIDANTTGLAGTVSGSELQVDVVAALPTGSNTIGDVTVSGDALTALQLIDDAIFTDDTSTHSTGVTKGAGIMAAATPTDGSVAANDIGMLAMSTDRRLHTDAQIVGQDADITIADGGNSITVDGTVTANLSATDNTVLDNIDTNTTGLAGTVSGSELQVDVVAALPAGDNNIGNVDIVTQPARDRLTDNVGVALQSDSLLDDTTALTPKFAAVNATASGDNTLVAAVAGKKIRVVSYTLVADAAVGAAFEDGAGGTELTGQMAFAANGGVSVPFSPVGHFETTANTLLNLELDASANVRGHLCYVEV